MKGKLRSLFFVLLGAVILIFGFKVYVTGEDKPKISIIMPVYKSEKWLRECMDSLVNQTLRDIEIICVNDGSPDNSLSILNEYAAKDKRVKIINQKNAGPSVARNRGIDESTGEYIKFVDSDDLLDLRTCQISYQRIKKENADMLVHGAYRLRGKKVSNYSLFKDRVITKQQFDVFTSPVWTGLYRRDIIEKNNIRYFPEIHMCEDQVFNMFYIPNSKKIVTISDNLYYYRLDNSGSICHVNSTKITAQNHSKAVRYVYDYWESKGYFSKIDAVVGYLRWYDRAVKEKYFEYYDWSIVRDLQERYKMNALENGTYTVSSAVDNNMVLDAGLANDKSLRFCQRNSTDSQNFCIKYAGVGCYSIEAKCAPKKAVDVKLGKKDLGTDIQKYNKNDTDSQKWYIVPAGDGYYNIISKRNGLFMTLANNNSNITCWESGGNEKQKFKLEIHDENAQ